MPIHNVRLGDDVVIRYKDLVNLYGCTIGNNVTIGPFVEIQKNTFIGNNVKIQSHTFICEGVTIEDDCFIGHGVIFINDKYPSSVNKEGKLQNESDWKVIPTRIKKGASIGSGSIILCGVTIGENSIVGAGSVVTKDILVNTINAGVPARKIRDR